MEPAPGGPSPPHGGRLAQAAPAMLVEPLLNLPFGCIVHGLQLADGVSDAEFSQLDEAFHKYGVVVLRGQVGLHPRHEVALARRLEHLWCDTPAIIEEREPNPVNLRGCNPPGFPEVAVLGNGYVSDHFGLTGKISVAGPLNWHEEADLGWHPDGAYDGREENVLTLFSCYASPSLPTATAAFSLTSTGTVTWPRPDAGKGQHGTAILKFLAGSTVFASTAHAFDLCSAEEQATLRTLQVRYFDTPTAMARRKRDLYPIMDPAGIRPLHPPPGPEPECEMSFTDAGFEANGSPAAPVAGGGLPEYSRVDGVSTTEQLMPVEPLVYVNRSGRESVRCHTVGMRRLEARQHTVPLCCAMNEDTHPQITWGWEASQSLVARVLGRATVPESVLVHDWRAGDVVLADNRCVLHSATPSDVFADKNLDMANQGHRLIHRISLPSTLPALVEVKDKSAHDNPTRMGARM